MSRTMQAALAENSKPFEEDESRDLEAAASRLSKGDHAGHRAEEQPEVIAPASEKGDVVPFDGVRIIAFACHYCAFAAADLAGVMRLSYEPSVKIIRLPCTGKLDHSYVLHAFERGVDGVFVAG